MATLYIDNKPYEFTEGRNLLQTCLELGFDIPYFCWHPALHSVGACRQCAVKLFKDETDAKGTIVMSCMTPARNGMRLSIDDGEVRKFRAEVIGFLMANHPHDCPVCDEGGECHLQDMTVLTGHNYREHRFPKRTHVNQDLGPFVHHEMNRCIACYRCVRFYRNYAGGTDLNVFGWHDSVYFGRQQSGVLESEFAGNLVEVCPTGVFTDKTLRAHYTRKWDLASAPSVCVHCSLGCNTIAGERWGTLRRILNRYNEEVNGHFLCDRGRFGYEFVNGPQRVRTPLVRKTHSSKLEPLNRAEALKKAAEIISSGGTVLGIGSGRASLESNFALRELVGSDRFFTSESSAGFRVTSEIVKAVRTTPAKVASLRDVALSGAVLVLGEDVTNTAPMLALAIRRASRNAAGRYATGLGIEPWNDAARREAAANVGQTIMVAAPTATKLDSIASVAYHATPDDVARLGFAIAHALDPSAPAPRDLSEEMSAMAASIAHTLSQSEKPLIVSGAGSGSVDVVRAAANVATALHKANAGAQMCMALSECNSFGCHVLGGRDLGVALADSKTHHADAVIVLENDLFRYCDPATVEALLSGSKATIVLDHSLTATAKRGTLVLPSSTFAEGSGTLVNNEGRIQRFFDVMQPSGDIQESFRWIRDIMAALSRPEAKRWESLDHIIADIAAGVPGCAEVKNAAPDADYRRQGQKVPRQTHRVTGRTAGEPNAPQAPHRVFDANTPLSFSPEGNSSPDLQSLVARQWTPGFNSVQAALKNKTVLKSAFVNAVEAARSEEKYNAANVAAYAPNAAELLAVPLHSIFGSEEQSSWAPGIAALGGRATIVLNPADAKRLFIQPDNTIEVSNSGSLCKCSAQIAEWVAPGIVAMSCGRPETQGIDMPQCVQVRKAGNA